MNCSPYVIIHCFKYHFVVFAPCIHLETSDIEQSQCVLTSLYEDKSIHPMATAALCCSETDHISFVLWYDKVLSIHREVHCSYHSVQSIYNAADSISLNIPWIPSAILAYFTLEPCSVIADHVSFLQSSVWRGSWCRLSKFLEFCNRNNQSCPHFYHGGTCPHSYSERSVEPCPYKTKM